MMKPCSPIWNVEEAEPSEVPFATAKPPVTLTVAARKLPQWALCDNSAADIDVGPHPTTSEIEKISLIPFGSTGLRIAAFPVATNVATNTETPDE